MRLSLAAFSCVVLATSLAAADPMQWGSVATSGGGYFVDVHVHPKAPERIFVMSDVGGPWVREPGGERYDLLGLNTYAPVYPMGQGGGLAFDPVDPDTLYVPFGQPFDRFERGLYRSTDAGRSWTRLCDKWGVPGGHARMAGPGVLVDPLDRKTIYFGTNQEGLWRSTDAGATWTQVRGPVTAKAQAVRSLWCDGRTQIDGRSAVVWMGFVSGDGGEDGKAGLEVSRDGGATFVPAPGWNEVNGGLANAWRIVPGSGDILWIATGAKLIRWDGKAFSDATPPEASSISAVDTDPTDRNRLVAVGGRKGDGCGTYRSRDGGKTWLPLQYFTWQKTVGMEPTVRPEGWYGTHSINLASQSIRIDPTGRTWLCDAFMTWRCDDVWAEPSKWTAQQRGLDNIVTILMACPPAGPGVGPLIAGVSDVRGFVWESPHRIPKDMIHAEGEWNSYVNGIAWCESQPQVMMVSKYNISGPQRILRSTDAGRSWVETKVHKRKEAHGGAKILISATDPDRVVFCPANQQAIAFSKDGGASWQPAVPAGGGERLPGFSPNNYAYNFAQQFASDKVDGKAFYAYRQSDDGKVGELWVSRDGGEVWAKSPTALPSANPHDDIAPVALHAVPGHAGWLYLALGNAGIWRSIDYGQAWTRLEGVLGSRPLNLAFGKEAPGAKPDQPTLYVQGSLVPDGPTVLRRSADFGATWEQIGEHPGFFARAMAADRQTYGRVYLASIAHASIIYGQINRADPVLTAAKPGVLVAGKPATLRVQLTDADSEPEALRLRVLAPAGATWTRVREDQNAWDVTWTPAAGKGELRLEGDDGGLLGTRTVRATVAVEAQ